MSMYDIFKKRVTKNVIWRIVISAAIMAVVLFFGMDSITAYIKGPAPITADMDYEAIEGSYVSSDMTYVIDEFVRTSSQNSKSGKETLKSIGYIIYSEEDGYFFGVEMPASKEADMDQAINDTIDYLNGDTDELTHFQSVKGTWTALTGKRYQYFEEQLTEDFGEDFLQIALPYYIDTSKVGDQPVTAVYMFLGILAAVSLYLVYILIRFATGSSSKKIRKYFDENPTISEAHMEADFAAATAVSKTIWVGKRWTYFISGVYAQVLENKKLVWGYYFQRTGRHSESTLRLFDTDKRMHALAASKSVATDALTIYAQQQPHMVIGYQKDLEKTYDKDFQGFLNLKYNRAQEDLVPPKDSENS